MRRYSRNKYFLIILIIISLTFINGCIDSNLVSQKYYINLTFDEINNKISSCDTELRCAELVETQLNNKYIMWQGKIHEVNDDIIVQPNINSKEYYPNLIRLKGVDKKTKLLLSKADIISYSGKFFLQNEVKVDGLGTYTKYSQIWKFATNGFTDPFLGRIAWLDITDVEIITINGISTSTKT